MERQLRRWSKQWEATEVADLPALDALRDELVRTLPDQPAASIVHGDYRLDNTILHPTRPGSVVAVLDWEMSTLGDPFTDLGALLSFWAEEADPDVLLAARIVAPVTMARASRRAPRSSSATRGAPASTSPTSPGTRRSRTSSSRSSARASPRARPGARWSARASTTPSAWSRRWSTPAGTCSAPASSD